MSNVDLNQVVDDSSNVAKAAISGGKEFWKSKTFWLNVLLVVAHYAGYLPPKVALPVAAGANLAVRVLTTQPLAF